MSDTELRLIPEGVHSAIVVDFGEIKPVKAETHTGWYLPVFLHADEYSICIYLSGTLATLILLKDNKDHFLHQTWKVKITHKTVDDQTYYNAERIRS